MSRGNAARRVRGPRAAAAAVDVPLGTRVERLLSIAYAARRPVLLEGETGIGKSAIVASAAAKLGVQLVILDLSLLEPPDLVGVPIFEGGRTAHATPAALPMGGSGILLLEELNRAERYMQQPALQLLTARRLHTYELPPGWACFAAINPEDSDYQVTPLDPALRARFLTIRVHPHRPSFLAWSSRTCRRGRGCMSRTCSWRFRREIARTSSSRATTRPRASRGRSSPRWRVSSSAQPPTRSCS